MRSPWVDLLLLHGHITPSTLSWHVDASPCGREKARAKVEVDVARLPLPLPEAPRGDCASCA